MKTNGTVVLMNYN